MDYIDLVKAYLDDYLHFLIPYVPLINSHMTDFYVDDLWNSMISQNIQDDLMEYEILDKLFSSDFSEKNAKHDPHLKKDHSWDPSLSPQLDMYESLDNILSTLKGHLNSFNDFIYTYESFVKKWNLNSSCSYSMTNFMSEKKVHEVKELTHLCGILCHNYNIHEVIDIGCGRGYLSYHLYAFYNLNVLGIDSSSNNIESLKERNLKLDKNWNTLVKKFGKIDLFQMADIHDSVNSSKDVPYTNAMNRYASTSTFTNSDITKKASIGAHSSYVDEKTNLTEVFVNNMSNYEVLKDQKSSNLNIHFKFLLTGLHTCGNLSSTMSRLFIEDMNTKILCTVPCCYNNLGETYAPQEFCFNKQLCTDTTFPISDFLKHKKFWLGRNARMLACQAIDRITKKQSVNSLSVHWRAMMQKMLVSKYGVSNGDWQVGRLFSKCSDFSNYVLKCVQKLNLEDCNFTPEYISEIEAMYASDLKHVDLFMKFKFMFAPLIEAIILMDNLLFLLERNTHDACIVKLFNPEKSPRCHALIAIK